jgi:hypothetical protein
MSASFLRFFEKGSLQLISSSNKISSLIAALTTLYDQRAMMATSVLQGCLANSVIILVIFALLSAYILDKMTLITSISILVLSFLYFPYYAAGVQIGISVCMLIYFALQFKRRVLTWQANQKARESALRLASTNDPADNDAIVRSSVQLRAYDLVDKHTRAQFPYYWLLMLVVAVYLSPTPLVLGVSDIALTVLYLSAVGIGNVGLLFLGIFDWISVPAKRFVRARMGVEIPPPQTSEETNGPEIDLDNVGRRLWRREVEAAFRPESSKAPVQAPRFIPLEAKDLEGMTPESVVDFLGKLSKAARSHNIKFKIVELGPDEAAKIIPSVKEDLQLPEEERRKRKPPVDPKVEAVRKEAQEPEKRKRKYVRHNGSDDDPEGYQDPYSRRGSSNDREDYQEPYPQYDYTESELDEAHIKRKGRESLGTVQVTKPVPKHPKERVPPKDNSAVKTFTDTPKGESSSNVVVKTQDADKSKWEEISSNQIKLTQILEVMSTTLQKTADTLETAQLKAKTSDEVAPVGESTRAGSLLTPKDAVKHVADIYWKNPETGNIELMAHGLFMKPGVITLQHCISLLDEAGKEVLIPPEQLFVGNGTTNTRVKSYELVECSVGYDKYALLSFTGTPYSMCGLKKIKRDFDQGVITILTAEGSVSGQASRGKDYIEHHASTHDGYSGAPVFYGTDVIGLHYGSQKKHNVCIPFPENFLEKGGAR